MIPRATKALINALSFIALCWIVLVLYQSIAGGRIWDSVYGVLESRAGTFAALALAMIVPLAGLGWLIARLLLRGRLPEDYPAAQARRLRAK